MYSFTMHFYLKMTYSLFTVRILSLYHICSLGESITLALQSVMLYQLKYREKMVLQEHNLALKAAI